MLIAAARAVGRRAVISHGWGNLDVIDRGADCIAIGDVDHAKLFPRVAAVVHHGGAGTTTAAASAGAPQLVVPHLYDQHYWANRVRRLGIGVAGPLAARLTTDALVAALRRCLQPGSRHARGRSRVASTSTVRGSRRRSSAKNSAAVRRRADCGAGRPNTPRGQARGVAVCSY